MSRTGLKIISYFLPDHIWTSIYIIMPSLSEEQWCTKGNHWRPISEFRLNSHGIPYKTCRECCERRRRAPLGEIDPNSRQLRGRSVSNNPIQPRAKRRRLDREGRAAAMAREPIAIASLDGHAAAVDQQPAARVVTMIR